MKLAGKSTKISLLYTQAKMYDNRRLHQDAYKPDDINHVWAYAVKYGDYRIYVNDDKTLSWFVLNHPAT